MQIAESKSSYWVIKLLGYWVTLKSVMELEAKKVMGAIAAGNGSGVFE
jgi:hypothetical protein